MFERRTPRCSGWPPSQDNIAAPRLLLQLAATLMQGRAEGGTASLLLQFRIRRLTRRLQPHVPEAKARPPCLQRRLRRRLLQNSTTAPGIGLRSRGGAAGRRLLMELMFLGRLALTRAPGVVCWCGVQVCRCSAPSRFFALMRDPSRRTRFLLSRTRGGGRGRGAERERAHGCGSMQGPGPVACVH